MKRLFLGLLLPLAICALTGAITAKAQSNYEPYSFTTFAGMPPGSTDGAGNAARFFEPNAAAADAEGNIYVADTANNTIRKITSAGVATTLAGLAGHPGSDDGTGSAARFNTPLGVAVDLAGNVYVADERNNIIRKITPAGVVTTLAGLAGNPGSDDGTGGAARIGWPQGLAVDAAGNVYVADTYCTIRKITPNAVVTTLAGLPGVSGSTDGIGNAARFGWPSGVAVDSAGNVYVSDIINSNIRKITPDAVVTTLAGSALHSGSDDGIGSSARFNQPRGLATDTGDNVYVADTKNHTIRKITPAAVVSTLAGLAGSIGSNDGTGSAARFGGPTGVAADTAGNVYVTDKGNHVIRKIVTADAVVTTFAGSHSPGSEDGTGSAARFYSPFGVEVDPDGNIFVADYGNSTIRKITPAGVVTTLAGLAGSQGSADGAGSAARFTGPGGVAVDSAGNLYVADSFNSTVRKITPEGVVTTFAGVAGSHGSIDGTGNQARFFSPSGVAVDAAGNVYVSDFFNNNIRKITPDAVVSTLAGLAGPHNSGSNDGTGMQARFNTPQDVAVDTAGNVYVADRGNNTIRKITPDAVVTTLAGLAGPSGSGSNDGIGSQARFDGPASVAVDRANNVYVADHDNNTIRKITPAGAVTTLAGLPGNRGSVDSTGSAARFNGPQGLVVDTAGHLWVVEAGNQTIRTGAPSAQVLNISTRMRVETGDNVLIGGFIIAGTAPKSIALRGIGPSLTQFGITDALANPTLELRDSSGALVVANDDWGDDVAQAEQLTSLGLALHHPRESGIVATLQPAAYTAILAGRNSGTGAGLVEVYDVSAAVDSHLANISTRGFVQSGNNVMIGGFILGGNSGAAAVVVRGIGPSLSQLGLNPVLVDPTLELHDGNGATLVSNDNWQSDAESASQLSALELSPADANESAIYATLPPGSFTAILTGTNGGTGIGLIEIYSVR